MPKGQINVLRYKHVQPSNEEEKIQAWLERSNQFLAIPNTHGSNMKEKT